MKNIQVRQTNRKSNQWQFSVEVDGSSFTVQLSDDYYQKLTSGEVEPEQLIEESFRFLLEREPASAILNEFDLPTINRYFPEYEQEIQERLEDLRS